VVRGDRNQAAAHARPAGRHHLTGVFPPPLVLLVLEPPRIPRRGLWTEARLISQVTSSARRCRYFSFVTGSSLEPRVAGPAHGVLEISQENESDFP
jgi:hypothetical protein